MANPAGLGGLGGLDGVESVVAQRREGVGDPLDVLLDRHRHVREHRRALRARHHEEVGEAGGHDAEVGERSVGPAVAQLGTVTAGDVDLHERAGHGGEPGGEHDHVDLVQSDAGPHAAGLDAHERILAKIDQADVREVERLVVAAVDAEPLGEDRVGGGAQRLGRLGVVDGLADLRAEELRDGVVGLLVDADVGEGAAEGDDVAVVPDVLVAPVALLLRHGQRALGRYRHGHARR